MNSIFKIAFISIISAISFFHIACDNNDDSSSDGNYTATDVIRTHSQVPSGTTGVVMHGCDSWDLIITSDCSIQRQRPSCSGFDNAGPNDLHSGDIVEFDVRDSYTIYGQGRPRTTPSTIKAYRQECTSGQTTPEVVVIDCGGDCD